MCIITDYCDAGDLYERLKKQSQKGQYLDEKHILRWLVQISCALQYVHEKNLLHRDLKTQNIFLTAKVRNFVRILFCTNRPANLEVKQTNRAT